MTNFRFVAACCLLLTPAAAAAEGQTDAPSWAVTDSVSVHLGAFNGNSNPQFSGQQNRSAFALAGNHHVSRHFAVGLDLLKYGQQYDSGMQDVFLIGVDDRMDMDTMALSGQALYVATASRAGFYAGGGAGVYRTTLTVEGDFLGIPGYVVDESDAGLGTHLLTGVALGVTENGWIDIQYRATRASADFGQYSNGKVDVGGSTLFVGFKYVFTRVFYPAPPPTAGLPEGS